MAELSIAYDLEHPDGTRIVFGNADAASDDPDFIGYLDPDNGLAGIDSPELREASALIVGGHGGIPYDHFHGRRPFVVNGQHRTDVAPAVHNALEQKIKRATNAMRRDELALLRWTNSGFPERRLAVQRNGPPRVGIGRRPKSFALELVCSDYRILSELERDSGVTARGAQAVVNNAGDELATPRFELTGPLTDNVILRNVTVGLEVRLKPAVDVLAGELFVVDFAPPWPTVTRDGVDAYGDVDFLPSSWWGLVPGNNVVEVTAGAGAGTWRIRHRDAWI